MGTEKKKSFVVYESWARMIAALPTNQAGELIKAICSKKLAQDFSINDETVKAMAEMIFPQLDADSEKYAQKCERISAARKKLKAQNHEENELELKKYESTLKNDESALKKDESESKYDSDSVSVSDSVSDSKNPTGSNIKKISASPSALSREFEAIWNIYPRKQERKDAFAAYCKDRKHGATVEQIMNGVKAYCAYIARNRTAPQYIKQGGTFFRQQAWADDWSGGGTGNPYLNNHPPDDLDGIL